MDIPALTRRGPRKNDNNECMQTTFHLSKASHTRGRGYITAHRTLGQAKDTRHWERRPPTLSQKHFHIFIICEIRTLQNWRGPCHLTETRTSGVWVGNTTASSYLSRVNPGHNFEQFSHYNPYFHDIATTDFGSTLQFSIVQE